MAEAIVVMGVSGSGKSTVGAAAARMLGVPFIDADDLHPTSNVEKMAGGLPLDDDDRWPWLDRVGAVLAAHPAGAVIACSALKRSYRDVIRAHAPSTRFILLEGTREVLAARMSSRPGHFMPLALLDSQLATLEILGRDEAGAVVDISETPDQIVAVIVGSVDVD